METLAKVVWPEARQLIDWLLSAIAAHRPQTWASVLDHPFLSEHSAFEQKVLEGLAEIKEQVAIAVKGDAPTRSHCCCGVSSKPAVWTDALLRQASRWCERRSSTSTSPRCR